MTKLKLTTIALVLAQVFVGSANAAVDQSAVNVNVGPASLSTGVVIIPPQGGEGGNEGGN